MAYAVFTATEYDIHTKFHKIDLRDAYRNMAAGFGQKMVYES